MNLEDKLYDEYGVLKKNYSGLGKPTKEKYGFSLVGQLQLIDPIDAKIWETYQIKVHIPFGYPTITPSTFEVEKKIPWNKDFHVDNLGKCCLAPRLEEVIILGRNYTLVDYFDKLVVPFFASQKLFELGQGKGIGEYSHFGAGIFEYYRDKFKTSDPKIILKSLYILADKNPFYRNQRCFCGSGLKFKRCHKEILSPYMIFDRRIFLDDIHDVEKSLATGIDSDLKL
jgi:hypothetical protein